MPVTDIRHTHTLTHTHTHTHTQIHTRARALYVRTASYGEEEKKNIGILFNDHISYRAYGPKSKIRNELSQTSSSRIAFQKRRPRGGIQSYNIVYYIYYYVYDFCELCKPPWLLLRSRELFRSSRGNIIYIIIIFK